MLASSHYTEKAAYFMAIFLAALLLSACVAQNAPVSQWWYGEEWDTPNRLTTAENDNSSVRPNPSSALSSGSR
jgi:hypothetical protein